MKFEEAPPGTQSRLRGFWKTDRQDAQPVVITNLLGAAAAAATGFAPLARSSKSLTGHLSS